MKQHKTYLKKLKDFFILWSTQSVSQLGSSITAFALTLWLYEQTGSSLSTSALTICSYAPYVLMSIFAGALTDRWNKKKTMLGCDVFAVCCTIVMYGLFCTNRLEVWHLYVLNAVSGLMNTVQQPASEVAMTLIIPKEYYQKTSGLRSFSRSLISILNPLIATAIYSFAGLGGVVFVDVTSFLIAFLALLFLVHIPEQQEQQKTGQESVLQLAKEGLAFLKANPLIMTLFVFMAGVNFVASAFDATLPGYVLPNPNGGSYVLGIVTSCSGVAMIIGSLLVPFLPKPKNRVRVIYLTMLFSLGTENLLLAVSREPVLWCVGQIIGWVVVPIMDANLDIILRTSIPLSMQGRVYACRNTFQFFTIPLGLFFGGLMVDAVCEPLMVKYGNLSLLKQLFGTGKGSGAACFLFILWVCGSLICLVLGRKLKQYPYVPLEEKKRE